MARLNQISGQEQQQPKPVDWERSCVFASRRVRPAIDATEMILGRLSSFWKLRKATVAGAEGKGPASHDDQQHVLCVSPAMEHRQATSSQGKRPSGESGKTPPPQPRNRFICFAFRRTV